MARRDGRSIRIGGGRLDAGFARLFLAGRGGTLDRRDRFILRLVRAVQRTLQPAGRSKQRDRQGNQYQEFGQEFRPRQHWPKYSAPQLSAFFHDGHRDARDAHEALAFVLDADFPDVAAPPDVERASGADDEAVADSAQVIGVDLLTYDAELVGIDDETRRGAAERLGERNRSAAVQDAERLPSAIVDRHAAAQEVRAQLGEFDAEVQRHAGAEEARVFERVRTEPDRGAHFCSFPAIRRYASRKESPSFTTSSLACSA